MAEMSLTVSGLPFEYIDEIVPERGDDGSIEALTPQQQYEGANSTYVHQYGWGPFCEFSISGNWNEAGVYIIYSADEVKYIGESQDIEHRFNQGYGSIYPRNCFEGGQQTNCRINSLIRDATTGGKSVFLFGLQTESRAIVEEQLINELTPPWNKQHSLDSYTSKMPEESDQDMVEDPEQKQNKYHGKYSPLKDYLRAAEDDEIELSFSEIEEILGFTLPSSAHKYSAWWSNGGQSHSHAWLDVGWKVEDSNFADQTIRFIRA
jgi:hypothetical protein